jgi:hypothetical protein
VPGQPELEVVQQGPMEWTPQPIGADLVEALGSYVLQEAANKRLGGQGHGVPTIVLGVLVAEAEVAGLDRDNTASGQGDPVDIPAQVIEHPLWALHGGFAVDHPPCRLT